MNRVHWRVGFTFILVSLGVNTASFAGYQAKKQVGKLTLDGWQLRAEDGQLGLSKTDAGKWLAGAPTITDAHGLYISADPDGKTPTVHLVKEKGAHANWAFEFLEEWKPGRAGLKEGRSNSHYLVGRQGFRFKMKVAEGPFKDWYVAVDPLPAEVKEDPTKLPKWRPLKLVDDAKSAAEFEYVDTVYSVGHK